MSYNGKIKVSLTVGFEFDYDITQLLDTIIDSGEYIDEPSQQKDGSYEFVYYHDEYFDQDDFNSNCDVTSLARGVSRNDEEGNLEYVFDDMWFCIPAPFKKGDIVWQRNRIVEAGPLVVEGITPDRYAETGHRGADSSDMNVWGYFQSYDGGIFYEVTFNYIDFEYYPEEMLIGKKRILKALSNYLKGKIDIELFSTAYQRILLEEQLKDTMPNCFTDEGLRLAGIIE